MTDRTIPKDRRSASLPAIQIERTVTNDVRLMLNLLAPTRNVARLIRDYETVLADHQAEMVVVNQFIHRANGSNPAQGRAPVRGGISNERDAGAAERVRTWLADGGSILR